MSVAFLWPDSEKALKSRAFGQNEKVGNFYQNYLPFVVEVRGIEPLSESVSSGTSPGADGNLHSLAQARAVTLESLVAS